MFNEPIKYCEKLIYEEQIDMSDNPVLLWNFRNVVIYIDGNGNIKFMKNKSHDAIDGAVSTVMALAGYMHFHMFDYDQIDQ